MLTTPMVARCHRSVTSISATEMLKLLRRRSFTLRSTWRLSLREWAASILNSKVRYAIGISLEIAGVQILPSQPRAPPPHYAQNRRTMGTRRLRSIDANSVVRSVHAVQEAFKKRRDVACYVSTQRFLIFTQLR